MAKADGGSAIFCPDAAKWSTISPLVHSLHTDAINHEPAILLMNTGNMVPGKPSLARGWPTDWAA